MSLYRREYSREFKLQVIREAASGTPVVEVAHRRVINANIVHRWWSEYRANPEYAFRQNIGFMSKEDATTARIAELEQKIGQLTMENDFLKKVLHQLEHRSAHESVRSGNCRVSEPPGQIRVGN